MKIRSIKILFGLLFLLILPFSALAQDTSTCNATGVKIYCKNPDGTCTSNTLSEEYTKSKSDPTYKDPTLACTQFGRTFVDCTMPTGLTPGTCATAGQPSTTNNSQIGNSVGSEAGWMTTGKDIYKADTWSQAECTSAGGDWISVGNATIGDYCFAKQDINYTPQIKIGSATIKNLGDYVIQVFNYSLGLLAMLAIIMVMIGGVQYILARGGAGVGQAKERISNAIFGLILALCAFLILQTINPQILKLSLPRVPLIKKAKPLVMTQADCSQYKDQNTCKSNPVGLNRGLSTCYVGQQAATAGGCAWDTKTSTCSQAPTPKEGALNGQCKDGNCTGGMKCVTLLGTGNCKACTDGKRGSPCGSGDDCVDADAKTCDQNVKQCVGDTMRPIGADCNKNEQCAVGSCYKAHCGSPEIGLACTGTQYRPKDVYPSWLTTVENWKKLTEKTDADAQADLQACRRPSYDGEKCLLSVTCQSGKCDKDNPNRTAQKFEDLVPGKCVVGSSKPSSASCQDNSECASNVCNPTGPTTGSCT